MRDYLKDLKQCIKRLYFAETELDIFLHSAGKEKGFFKSLDLEGFKPEFRHPILDYDENEKECFIFICGLPLQLPQDFSVKSPVAVIDSINSKRSYLRYIAGMLEKSRWLGEKNYLYYKSRKKRYFTGRLIG